MIDGLGQIVFTGEGYSCNAVTRVTTGTVRQSLHPEDDRRG